MEYLRFQLSYNGAWIQYGCVNGNSRSLLLIIQFNYRLAHKCACLYFCTCNNFGPNNSTRAV